MIERGFIPPQLHENVELPCVVYKIKFFPNKKKLYIWYRYIPTSDIFLVRYPQEMIFNRRNNE